MDVAVRVCVSVPGGYEFHQLIDDLPILLELEPSGVIYRQRHTLPGPLASLSGDRPPLSGSGELALKHLVDQRALPNAGAASDQYVESAHRPFGLFDTSTDHRQDVLRPRGAVDGIVRKSSSSQDIVRRLSTPRRS